MCANGTFNIECINANGKTLREFASLFAATHTYTHTLIQNENRFIYCYSFAYIQR